MTAKAIELANQGEKVLFLIFNAGNETSSCESLLLFDLEEKFKDYEKASLSNPSCTLMEETIISRPRLMDSTT